RPMARTNPRPWMPGSSPGMTSFVASRPMRSFAALACDAAGAGADQGLCPVLLRVVPAMTSFDASACDAVRAVVGPGLRRRPSPVMPGLDPGIHCSGGDVIVEVAPVGIAALDQRELPGA